MFDVKAEIGLTLPSPEGPKKIVVRFPTDNEFIEWRRKKKILQRDLGRRSFQIESSRPESCDLDLLRKIRTDKDGPAIDDAESFYVIGQLADCEVSQRPEREGSSFTIRMKIMRKLATTHTLKLPSVKEMMDYERARSSVVFAAYGSQEIKINFRASADLYDKLKISTEGYAGDVPVPHKAEAVNILLQEIRAEQEEAPEADEEAEG
jgi:hypothetical protein